MRSHWSYLLFFFLIFQTACKVSQPAVTVTPADNVDFIILQLNDVYEIAPLEGGKAGGLARVATLKKQLMRETPNVIAVLCGDFLSPSFMGTLRLPDGEKIAGLQMVETLNAMGMDYVTFGNHEFDLSEPELLMKRMAQSHFRYISANALWKKEDGSAAPFVQAIDGKETPAPPYLIHQFKDSTGTAVNVGILGVVLPFNMADYVEYRDFTQAFQQAFQTLRSRADFVVALTHLSVEQDLELAAAVPGVPLFLGGHDHANMTFYVENTIITKADANAKTVYVHRVTFNRATGFYKIRSSLVRIDDTIDEDPVTKAVVDKWKNSEGAIMQQMGYRPDRQLMTSKVALRGTEAAIRTQPTNYGKLTNQAFEAAWPGADLYLFNSGSLRIDDDLTGVITEYDVLRTFPFGGPIVKMNISGANLRRLLDTGLYTNMGVGGYLQTLHLDKESLTSPYLIRGEELQFSKTYTAVMPEFLALGKEQNLEFLADSPFDKVEQFDMNGVQIRNDIRDIVIRYMEVVGEW